MLRRWLPVVSENWQRRGKAGLQTVPLVGGRTLKSRWKKRAHAKRQRRKGRKRLERGNYGTLENFASLRLERSGREVHLVTSLSLATRLTPSRIRSKPSRLLEVTRLATGRSRGFHAKTRRRKGKKRFGAGDFGIVKSVATWRLKRSGRDTPDVSSLRLASKIDGWKSHYFRSQPSALAQASLLNIFS